VTAFKVNARRFGVSLLVVAAMGVSFVGSARADPPAGVVVGCLTGHWATQPPNTYPTFNSEGECVNYLKQGGSIFTQVSGTANNTVIAYIGFNDAGVITAISIKNGSPNEFTLPCGEQYSETIYNDTATYSITAGPGETVTFNIPEPSPFFLYTAGPDKTEAGPGSFHISLNFNIAAGGGSLC
jgi:hypothetical protein